MNEHDVREALHRHGEAWAADAGAAAPGTAAGWDDVEQRAARMQRAAARKVWMASSAAAAVLVLVAALLLAGDEDKRVRTIAPAETTTTEDSVAPTTTAAPAATSTTVVETTTTTGPPPDPAAVGGIYPDLTEYRRSGTGRYAEPVATAVAFAKDYVGMKTPVAGRALAGDSPGSRRVSIRPNSRASLTTVVELRQVGPDGPWTVVEARAESIVLDSPGRDAAVASPLRLSGSAQAFEGHVNVEVREEGMRAGRSLGKTFVTGASDQRGPFTGEVQFRRPSKSRGAVVLFETSAEDGSPIAATVVRLTFKQA